MDHSMKIISTVRGINIIRNGSIWSFSDKEVKEIFKEYKRLKPEEKKIKSNHITNRLRELGV